MRVKNAIQVFSNSVASRLEALSGGPERNTSIGVRRIPEEGRNTSYICSFFNDVADAFNGKVLNDENSELRTLLTEDSFHLKFFEDAARQVGRMRYVNVDDKKRSKNHPPSLKNLKLTMERIPILWNKLKSLGFKSLKTVHLNQDCLENFFSKIRQSAGPNRKPTFYQFQNNFKTLVINNISSFHSEGANCIDDGSKFALSWRSYFNTMDENSHSTTPSCMHPPEKFKLSYCKSNSIPEKINNSSTTEFVCKNMFSKLQSLQSCEDCKTAMNQIVVERSHNERNGSSKIEEMVNDVKSI